MKAQNVDFDPHVSRRSALLTGAKALIAATIFPLLASFGVNVAPAANSPPKHGLDSEPNGANDMNTPNELLDSIAVADIIMRERLARESHNFAAEAACFHPDAIVEVSWFKGSGAEFVDAAKRTTQPKRTLQRILSISTRSTLPSSPSKVIAQSPIQPVRFIHFPGWMALRSARPVTRACCGVFRS